MVALVVIGIDIVCIFAPNRIARWSETTPGALVATAMPLGSQEELREQVIEVALDRAFMGLGYVGYLALKSIDDHPLELLITLALVMFLYALSFWVHVSGPIAVVVAGLFIGNRGRRLAMSDRTREHVDAFWRMPSPS